MGAGGNDSMIASDRCSTGAAVLRVIYIELDADPAGAFARAASAGFSHVLVAPPWSFAADRMLSTHFDRFAPGIGAADVTELSRLAKAAGVGLLLDVVVDRVAGDAAWLGGTGVPFGQPMVAELLDPRHSLGAEAAHARLGHASDAAALAAWWVRRMHDWVQAGLAGFRVLGLDSVPPSLLRAFLMPLRYRLPEAIVLAWTPGLDREAILSLAGLGLDGVFASVPWWNWQADWLWDEVADLSQVAPVLGVDGRPPSYRSATVPAAPRATALAALVGQGWLHVGGTEAAGLAELNAVVAGEPVLRSRSSPSSEGVGAGRSSLGLPLGDAGRVLAVLRTEAADPRTAGRVLLAVINADGDRAQSVQGSALLPPLGGRFQHFTEILTPGGDALTPATVLDLPPGGLRLFAADQTASEVLTRPSVDTARAAAAAPRLAIEQPSPAVDGGAFPVKAIAGELVSVQADIIFDGHDKIAAALRWHGPDGAWFETPMRPLGNDRWQGAFPLSVIGRHAYVVGAWYDGFETFRDELTKKSAAGLDVALELIEGEALVSAAAARSADKLAAALSIAAAPGASAAARVAALLSPALAQSMAQADDRPFLVQSAAIPVDAERIGARFASWYEVFPRSMSDDEARHGSFADVERHLPRIAAMGFDVLYFPPVSPIGRVNRKGRNNTLTPAPDDPGSPYAVGSADGGHDALHPQLGTLADFQHLRHAAAAHGLELAVDFAIQCSPDHPWLKQHPGWFDWRPDGSIRYAENPPKKYEDIVNVDFYARDAIPELWTGLCDVVLFWADQGVRLFRVDNPHTKPLPFWEWMIGQVRTRYPDTVFLAEAFTRPKVMYRLAKVGFSQSYTYFTWRNTKRELEAYLTELDTEPPRDFFRPHFFVNTPDINPVFLQTSGRPGFLIRAALAATLSGLWGIYNGFELCEAAAVPGKEEYLDSEKYQLRAWDWDRPGNIVSEITVLNRLRRQNPALQTHLGVTFLSAANDAILYYEKATPDRSNVVLVAVSLDPFQAQEADFELPLWRWKLPDDANLQVQDLVDGSAFVWRGKVQHMRLTPDNPYAIWRLRSL